MIFIPNGQLHIGYYYYSFIFIPFLTFELGCRRRRCCCYHVFLDFHFISIVVCCLVD